MAIFYTDSGSFNILEVSGSTILSGSLIVSGTTNFGPTGLTGSLFGTSSIAQTASFVEFTNIANRPALVSSSAFTSPSQGTVRATINGVQTDVDTGLQTGDSPQFTNLFVSSTVTASIVSASTALTASNVQLNNVTDTTATNKVLVLNTATNQIFTTASVGSGGSGNGFPFSGSAVITGSLLISQSVSGTPALRVTGSTILSSSGTSLQVTGSSNFRDNLTVNGGTLFVDTANNRTNMSGSIAVTGSMTMLSSSLVINTGSITINTGSLTVDQLPGQTSGIILRVTGSNQVLYIGNDGQGSSFLKTNNTQLRFGGLGSTGFAWDGLSLYPEATDEEGLGSTSNRWQRLVVNQVTASIVSASAGITGSLAQFNPVSLKITVGTTAPSSPAVNDLWVDTN
jgi:hypothetical protein